MPHPPIVPVMPRIPSNPTPAGESAPAVTVRARRNAPAAMPTPEAIRVRAYEIYVARGREPGHEAEDWAQAERELLANPNQLLAK